MLIEILSVTTEHIDNDKGGYDKASVAYKDDTGKVTGKNIVSFVHKDVYSTLTKASAGDRFDVKNEKIGNNWNWTGIKTLAEGEVPTPAAKPNNSGASKSYNSTYPTPEERAKTQVYIVRQSSLSNAIAFATEIKTVKTPEAVIKLAKQFEEYVLDTGDNLTDDIPD